MSKVKAGRATITIVITVLIALLTLLLALVPQTVRAATYTEKPQLQERWESHDLGGVVRCIAWSPDKTKLAVGVGSKVVVFSVAGNKVWEKDLESYVRCIAWGPDGSKLAVGTHDGGVIVFSSYGEKLWDASLGGLVRCVAWSPNGAKLAVCGDFQKVIVFSNNGARLWERTLGGWVTSVSWSSDGTKLAAGAWRLVVFTDSGSHLWETPDLGGLVYTIDWSPDNDKIAVGGAFQKVIVFSSAGARLWESPSLGGAIRCIAWSPEGTKLAVRGDFRKVIVLSSTGAKLWDKTFEGWIESIAWSPDETKLVAGGFQRVIIFSGSGEKLWDKYMYGTVYSVAWSPDGSKLAIGGDFGKIMVFSGGGFGTVLISGSPLGLKVCFYDGRGTYNYMLDSSGLKLYADPGEYEVKYYLIETPTNYTFARGVTDYLKNHPVTVTLTIKAGEEHYLTPPSIDEFLHLLGKIIVRGTPDCEVELFGTSTSYYTIPPSGELEVYVVPGEYHVTVYPSFPCCDIGNVEEFVREHTVYKNVTVPAGGSVVVSAPSIPELGTLKITGPAHAKVKVSWASSSKEFTIPRTGVLTLKAVPGEYSLVVRPRAPYCNVGDIEGFVRKYTVSRSVSVPAGGSVVVSAPSIPELGTLKITGPAEAVIVVSWGSSSMEFTIPSSGVLELKAVPNTTYTISISSKSASIFGEIVGSIDELSHHGISVNVGNGSMVSVDLMKTFFGVIKLVNPSSVPATFFISWSGGEKQFMLGSGYPDCRIKSVYAVPGVYSVNIMPGVDVIGSLEERVEQVEVSAGKTVSVTGEPLSSIGFLFISNPSPLPVVAEVSWSSGTKRFRLDVNGNLLVPAVSGEYTVKYAPAEKLIGFTKPITVNIRVMETHTTKVETRIDTGAISFTNGPGEVVITLSDGTTVWSGKVGNEEKITLATGEYKLMLKYTGTAPNFIVGDLGDYQVECSVDVHSNGIHMLDLKNHVFNRLGALKITGPAGAVIVVSWGSSSMEFTIPSSGVLELKAVPNTTYTITVGAPDILHSPFTATITVPSAGSCEEFSVTFPLSPFFYAMISGIAGLAGALFYAFVVRARVVVKLLTREIIMGVNEVLKIEFRNAGLKKTTFKASIELEGKEVFTGIISLPGRSRRIVLVRWRKDSSSSKEKTEEGS